MAKRKKAKTKRRARRAPAHNGAAALAANDRHVSVRMYNVGFGDAFLVTIANGGQRHRILFDCGSIEAAADLPMKKVVTRIIADATDEGGTPRIDVVVATHRHKDHVSGFAHDGWGTVHVREVWMPWTEDPRDDEARRIRDIQSRLALGLQAALAARGPGVAQADAERAQLILGNALTLSNDKAMKILHGGFAGDPQRRFLPGKEARARTFETDALPGVRIHVLGPSRSRDVIRDMDPPKGGSFLRLRGSLDPGTGTPPAPFSAEFRHTAYSGTWTLPPDDVAEIQRAGSISDLAVAVALDKAVNGTSLMLMLEISGTYLLFPGDAQWGTWQAAMDDPEWREMLTRVAFYKIGHHGSHNATPRLFVDDLIPDGVCAMASTLTRAIWPDIPRGPLLDGLKARNALVARSDRVRGLPKPYKMDGDVIELRIPL